MRLVNIWAKSPGGSWTLAKNVCQLAEDSVGITPLGKRFCAADGTQIYYSTGAAEQKTTLQFEVNSEKELQNLMRILRNGTAYAESLMVSGYTSSLGNCGVRIYIDGDASIKLVSRKMQVYQITVPVILDQTGAVTSFPNCYIVANPSGACGITIVKSPEDTSIGIVQLTDSGKQLEDGSVQLPPYTANAEETAEKSIYIRFQAAHTFPTDSKITVEADGVNGWSERHDITDYVTNEFGTIGMALTGIVTEFCVYLHYTYGGCTLERIYRIRVYAPDFQEGEA